MSESPPPTKPQLRAWLWRALVGSGLVLVGAIAGNTWMLPIGGDAEPAFADIKLLRSVAGYESHPARYGQGAWILVLPFTDPVKLKVRALVRGIAGSKLFAFDGGERWSQVWSIPLGTPPLWDWQSVDPTLGGLAFEMAELEVTSPNGSTKTWRWP